MTRLTRHTSLTFPSVFDPSDVPEKASFRRLPFDCCRFACLILKYFHNYDVHFKKRCMIFVAVNMSTCA